MNPSSAGSNRPLALRLIGSLDFTSLHRSLSEIVRRHEVLRTVFVDVEGEPMQQVLPAEEFPLPTQDLGGLPERVRLDEARRIAVREAQQPFDFAAGPPVRGLLLRLGGGDHVLLLLMHHIVFDGWSEAVFVNELATLYGAFARGEEPPLPELAVQYADFATWQRDRLQAGELDGHLVYWKKCLEPLPPHLYLPTDFPPLDGMPVLGGEVRFGLGRELSERLRVWCRRERVTPFMVLLAGFEATLGRVAGQERFLVGVPIAGRFRAETQQLLGCFMNVVVTRADLSRGCSFRRLVQQVKEQTLEFYDRQELPFERLVEALRPKRDRHRWPLFDVMVNMRTLPRAGTVGVAGLEIGPFTFDRARIEGLSLSLEIQEETDGFQCTLTYAAELFRSSSAERLTRRLLTLLDAALEAPDRPIARIPLMAEPERREILEKWNATFVPDEDPAGVHELVAAQARRAPGAIAVVTRGGALTYGRLEARANQLAHYLRSQGIGPETIVAIYLDRSSDLIVAVLGVLKAGAAFVLADPGVAPERTRLMLEDAAAAAVLTVEALRGELPGSSVRVWALDALGGVTGSLPTETPAVQCHGENLAYLIFASGAGGRPKGILVTHGALRNHLRWRVAHFSYTPADRILHSAPLGSEDAVWELLAPLVGGAGVLLAGADEYTDPTRLVRLIRDQRPTGACFAPAMLSAVLDQPEIRECTSLRMVYTGGDVLPAALQDRFHSVLAADLFNRYGPAEAAAASTLWRCRRGHEASAIPIGTPIANTRTYVLDEHLEPVPVGIRGELYIGGAGLARGYLHAPAGTAAAFIPDPFGPPGGRLYRTGDLARYREDGALELEGRRDQQVRIRGNRVELGEIETVLRTHAAIQDAAVAAEGSPPAGLVGFLVAAGARPDLPKLRAYLRRRLPEHMVPARFVVLPVLPRTSGGKVDRRALPTDSAAEPESPYVAPRTLTELRLTALWAALLRRNEVGIDDDFFALGGDSLLAAQAAGRVQTTFGVELSVRDVFEAPTAAGLAGRIDARRPAEASPGTPSSDDAVAGAVEQFVFPTSFAQRSLWRLQRLDPQGTAYVMAQAHHLSGILDHRALAAALQDLVARHETLRTSFTAIDGEPMQVVASRASVGLPVIELGSESDHDRLGMARQAAAVEAATPFDLARGPLLRARLLRLAPEEHVLLLAVHHIIADEWSLGLLSGELEQCYRAHLLGQAPRLAELPVQYADYTIWQREWLSDAVLSRELSYWRERLAGAPSRVRLPFQPSPSAAASYQGARRSLTLGPALADAMRELSRREDATLFMALLAGFGVLLGRYSGEQDVLIGSPVAGRPRSELEGLVGLFVNTLPLRLELGGNPRFRDLLDRVRRVVLGAYAHQELPFERLAEALQPEWLERRPALQIQFQAVNAPRHQLRLSGLEVRPLPLERAAMTSDLALAVRETEAGLQCECAYRTDLFAADAIGCLLQEYGLLLQQVADDPERRLEEYSLAPPGR